MVQKTKKGRSAGQRVRPSKDVARQTDKQRNTATPRVLASALTAVLDSQGMVVGVLSGRTAARAFLREARL